ncbi:MAG TPA: c-type cytochrome [Candidatus Solibacter sp.]|nr:c-type cytochrome [Candidatus Solibacter sp.]
MAAQPATFSRNLFVLAFALFSMALASAAADGSWLKHVPEADRARKNPYAGQADAIAAGALVFEDHCAKCHGADAEGRGKKPSLRSSRVQGATDGEIFWLLKNGNLAKGMPTWSKLPEQTRWQVIAYLKSLGKSGLFGYSGKSPLEVGR